jgi:hypothetical protein
MSNDQVNWELRRRPTNEKLSSLLTRRRLCLDLRRGPEVGRRSDRASVRATVQRAIVEAELEIAVGTLPPMDSLATPDGG